ncbi:DUF6266 family protein [Algoriphagus winogradskyi]|uniref:Uncharacterized protein n=1 Tax=Algoriphagus winogradskyi TaxID=237017 RepID=A0ABY1PB41_9BACT|nr:DUF6266 family protein [Algoriphagus winogradskyi]SMP29772.1 hypothetical protein SAMN06265367_106179 [Algoriphagus winogradskyi]
MARITNSILEGLSGSVGELVFYKVGGKTYSRRKPGKQSKTTKAKTSERKRNSQSVTTQTQKFLKNIAHVLRFGYQNFENGASRPYHAAVSYTMKNSFKFEGTTASKMLDISLVKVSRGSLLGPQDPKVERVPEGIKFTWTDNSWQAAATPYDNVFVFLLSSEGIQSGSEWEFLGNTRDKGSHVLPVSSVLDHTKWHAWIAFSQENPWTKKKDLSDSVYLGIV